MIILVRHGETALNAARVVQPADTPLSGRGLAQAELLAVRLQGLGVARILASDMPRALMTAAAVERLTGVAAEETRLLHERNLGVHRGTPYAELTHNIFAQDYEPPEGESWAAFDARVGDAWRLMLERARDLSGNLVVVTHGLVCRSLAQQFLSLPVGTAPDRFGNTSLTTIGKAAPYRVELLNCTAHLEGDAADDSGGARV